MADEVPSIMLRRLAEDPRFRAKEGLASQRDALARSLWAYLYANDLFASAERAMQVRVYRDHGRLYEAWSIDTSIPLEADAVDRERLADEIAAQLHDEDGCKVETVDLPSEDSSSREVLVAVIFFGDYASQKTVAPDKSTGILYYRPPSETLLVYSRDRRRIEVCSRDATERRLVAKIFASEALQHDVSNKPLTQKTYNLLRFRTSLNLPIPEEEAHRVRRACITEVQVALGDWAKRVTLSVTPDDDIDAMARCVFGSIVPQTGGGYVTKIRFHIDYVDGRGQKGSLKFDVFGRNKSNIQSERDPAKRALGYDLLEAWGILERVGDLSKRQRSEKIPQILVLYDLNDAKVSGAVLDGLGIDAQELVTAGLLRPDGWSDVVLFDDDDFGELLLDAKHAPAFNETATLALTEGGSGPQVAARDLCTFAIRFDYVRDVVTDALKPLGLKGRVREVAPHVHQVGVAEIGLTEAPIYLARALSDDKFLQCAERLIRGEASRFKGIVFVPQEVRFPYISSHVVLSLVDSIDPETGLIDPEAVRVAYEAAVDPAGRGATVQFRKQSDEACQILVPGQDPRIVTGRKKVLLFERLYVAHRDREPPVKLAELKQYAGFSQLPQLFGSEWEAINNRYLYSPRWAHWALCDEPISV